MQFALALSVSRAMNGAEFRTQRSGSTIELLCRGERVISAFGILTVGQERKNKGKKRVFAALLDCWLEYSLAESIAVCDRPETLDFWMWGKGAAWTILLVSSHRVQCASYPGSGACCFLQILHEQGFSSTLDNWDNIGSSDTIMFALKFAIMLWMTLYTHRKCY